MDALSASNRNIVFDVSGTIALPTTTIQYVTGRSNFTLDGGGVITLTGAPLWFRSSCTNFIVKNIRHRGGWLGDAQSGDCFTVVGCSNFVFQHVSVSGFTDEGISFTGDCTNWSRIDCLVGGSFVADGHSYGSLNAGGPGSDVRTTFIGCEYRNPQVEGATRYDIVNAVVVGYDSAPFSSGSYGLVANTGAQVNLVNPYFEDLPDLFDGSAAATLYHTGAVSVNSGGKGGLPTSIASPYSTPAYAQVTPMTASEAKEYAKTNAGCLPHDSFDTTLLASIT